MTKHIQFQIHVHVIMVALSIRRSSIELKFVMSGKALSHATFPWDEGMGDESWLSNLQKQASQLGGENGRSREALTEPLASQSSFFAADLLSQENAAMMDAATAAVSAARLRCLGNLASTAMGVATKGKFALGRSFESVDLPVAPNAEERERVSANFDAQMGQHSARGYTRRRPSNEGSWSYHGDCEANDPPARKRPSSASLVAAPRRIAGPSLDRVHSRRSSVATSYSGSLIPVFAPTHESRADARDESSAGSSRGLQQEEAYSQPSLQKYVAPGGVSRPINPARRPSLVGPPPPRRDMQQLTLVSLVLLEEKAGPSAESAHRPFTANAPAQRGRSAAGARSAEGLQRVEGSAWTAVPRVRPRAPREPSAVKRLTAASTGRRSGSADPRGGTRTGTCAAGSVAGSGRGARQGGTGSLGPRAPRQVQTSQLRPASSHRPAGSHPNQQVSHQSLSAELLAAARLPPAVEARVRRAFLPALVPSQRAEQQQLLQRYGGPPPSDVLPRQYR